MANITGNSTLQRYSGTLHCGAGFIIFIASGSVIGIANGSGYSYRVHRQQNDQAEIL
jgi:hypothetical protein